MFRIYDKDRPGFYFGVIGLGGLEHARATFYAAQQWCRDALPADSWHPEQWTVVIHDEREATLFKIRWC